MSLIDAAIKDLNMIGDCRTCGNKTPFCDSNPDSCDGYNWRGAPPGSAVDENPPLTPEELLEMDGDPVWLSGNGLNRYDILKGISTDGVACFLQAALPMDCCGKTWVPYRCKPEEATLIR